MKNLYIILLLVSFPFFNTPVRAQILKEESGEFTPKEDYLKDFEEMRKQDPICCSGETPDLSFNISVGSALSNHDIIERARAAALEAWFNRQHNLMKNEIGNRFNKNYSNFDQAKNDYFKNWEKQNILSRANGVKNKYDTRVRTRNGIKEKSLRNLKLLELRRIELNIGNINNTSYGSFNFNGVPIGDIRTLSQLNTLRDQEIGTFGTNEWKLHDDSAVNQFLYQNILNGMGNYTNRYNFNYNILNELLSLQINHYNNTGQGLPWHPSWYQLDLMQMYLNNIRVPLVQIVTVGTADFGTASFLENYANQHRGGGTSIFDPAYENAMINEAIFGRQYGDTIEEAIEQAEYQVEMERLDYIDDLLGDVNVFDDQVINKLTGKADCVYQKLKDNSLLKKTLQKFNGTTPVNLIIKQQSNLRDNNGKLVNGFTDYGKSYNVIIILNTEQANNRPSLAVARTILHEVIHAEIYRKVKTNGGLVYHPNSLPHYTLPDGSRANFPSLFDAYNEDTSNPYHNYMAKYYREALEAGLKEYASAIGESHSDQFYKDMAWSGLLETKAWEKQYANSTYANKEKKRIKNVIINYEKSRKNECK